jgi:hypothetical protein
VTSLPAYGMPIVQVTNSYCGLAALFQMCALAAGVLRGAMLKRRSLNHRDGGSCQAHLTSSDCCLAEDMFSLSHSVRTVRRSISNSSRFVSTATSPFLQVSRSDFWNRFLRCLLTSRRRRTLRGLRVSSGGCVRDGQNGPDRYWKQPVR